MDIEVKEKRLDNRKSPEESKPNEKEELVAQQMVDCLHGFVTDSLFEDHEALEEIPDSQVSSYSQQLIVDDGGKERNEGNEFKHAKYKKRREERTKRGGTRFEQWRYIDEHTYGRFLDARKELKCIKESNLKLWAAEAAQSFRDASFKFKACSFWIAKFKEKHSISSRKITKLVSKREVASMESILEAATKFQQTIKRISPQYPSHLVLNTDQVGFMYELTGNRFRIQERSCQWLVPPRQQIWQLIRTHVST
ncbi:unnamed protein product [Orchesella dallaii]|uniref:HTH CENPB-type domain-containing protein n=1 Tax=Orchesella dallaii TaxID=48710 RepID=A0ABP1R7P7_9HEXA